MKVLVLLSGGLDSTTVLADAVKRGHNVSTLSFDYGQRHAIELAAAEAVAGFYRVPHSIIDLSSSQIFEGALSSQVGSFHNVPEGHYADESMKLTIVPNRNMMLLAIAGAAAISRGAEALVYGAHAGDHAIYPDCRPQFVGAMREAFRVCDWKPLDLEVPFLRKTKADIVTIGHELNVPFLLTYSCYKGQAQHCGKCGTCVERREAFVEAGVSDPTPYTD